jgi:hypothetical protein
MDFARSGEKVPNNILGVIKGPQQNWSAEHVEHEVTRCIEVLSWDVQRSRTILQVTFAVCASSWKRSVCLALLDREGSSSAPESGVSATSGVPNGLCVLREMVHAIDEIENEETDKEIDFEVSRVISMCQTHCQGCRTAMTVGSIFISATFLHGASLTKLSFKTCPRRKDKMQYSQDQIHSRTRSMRAQIGGINRRTEM